MASGSPASPRPPPLRRGRFRFLSLHAAAKMAAAACASAASPSFLGFSAASRDPAAASRRARRGPRNRKKAWKRWGGPEARLGREVADFLEEVAQQQRTAGGLISEQPDQELFFLDTGTPPGPPAGTPKEPLERPLRVDLVLQNQSRVQPPRSTAAARSRLRLSAATQRRRRDTAGGDRSRLRLSAAPQRPLGAAAAALPGAAERGRSEPARAFYDLWGQQAPPEQDLWFLQQTKKLQVKPPRSLQERPGPAVAAVELPAPGASYNPALEDHQALLLQAHEEEVRKRREEEKVERQLRVPAGVELGTEESRFREQCQGLLEEEEEEEKEGDEEEEAAAPAKAAPGVEGSPEVRSPEVSEAAAGREPPEVRRRAAANKERPEVRPKAAGKERPEVSEAAANRERPEVRRKAAANRETAAAAAPEVGGAPRAAPRGQKKTEQQRRREREARIQEGQRRREKAARLRRQDLFRLRSLRRELLRRDAELRCRRRRRQVALRERRARQPGRLGRLRYQPPPLAVQLSEELADSLRTLKPEGSLLLERFKSLQRRGLIEPRERAKFKRRYKLKYVEKRSFRAVTL